MNIFGLVRARNEARWIRRCVESMKPLCSQVFLLDDHSIDVTAALARTAGAIVWDTPFDRLHEADDKQWLYEKALSMAPTFGQPDWCLMLDGDEMLAPGCADMIRASISAPPVGVNAFRFKIVYLWDQENQKRVDRWYDHFTRPSLWKVAPGQQFRSGYTNGLHCGNTPDGMSIAEIPGADILHFGYLHREDRVRKFHYYNEIDPGNVFEDNYRHMVIGDLPQYPASYVGKWAGPLALEAL